ncbi:uncharacterized protein [Epargyreus clarus]|uniref:uncharacterized protein n=1 Tax=Epargyreus clarus TaxID=520877 RepID=UPI003C2B547F
MSKAFSRIILKTFFIFSILSYSVNSYKKKIDPVWKATEKLTEKYQYVVALLNANKEFECSGTIIGKRTIITSGNCITPQPYYVAVGVAVYNRNTNEHNIFEIAFVRLHTDYIYELQESEFSVIKMQSNIGLVFTYLSVLNFYIESPVVGNMYASELKNKTLVVVGYAKMRNSNAVGLQAQIYNQMPCINPKWYYCICGNESKSKNPKDQKISKGAPLLVGTSVVGIAACPCVSLARQADENKYNIFTVIRPYLRWIHRVQRDYVKFRIKRNHSVRRVITNYVYCIILLTNKVFI